MNPIRWIKSKLADWDRRAGEHADRTKPDRDRKAAELKQQIAEMEEKLKSRKSKRQ